MIRGEWAAAPRTIRWLLIVQVVLIVAAALLSAYRYPLWSIDEGAHYDYVQYIAEDGRLPVLGEDPAHDEVLALSSGTYPRPSGLNPRKLGFSGQSYEAFQPPLYYALAAPLWFLSPDHGEKVKILRGFGVLLLVLAVVALAALCRVVVGQRWPFALVFAMLVFLTPGVLLRQATIGNAALEPLVATVFVALVVTAWKRSSYRWLAVAGVALGACLLSRLVLGYLVPVFLVVGVAIWWKRGRSGRQIARLLVALAVPLILLTPWLAFNRSEYGAWTAGAIARKMQAPAINPRHVQYDLWGTLKDIPGMTDFAASQEWTGFISSKPFSAYALEGFRMLMLPISFIFMLVLGRRVLRGPPEWICVLAYPLALAALILSTVIADWPQTLSRYVVGALPAWAVVASIVLATLLPRDRDFTRFVVIVSIALGFALVQLSWSAFVDGGWVAL